MEIVQLFSKETLILQAKKSKNFEVFSDIFQF